MNRTLADAAATLRGRELRSWLDDKRPIDIIGDLNEHEASERYGAALIELGETLMRMAKASRELERKR